MARPNSKKIALIRNTVLWAALIAAIPPSARILRKFESDDPLGSLLVPTHMDPSVLMRMEGVRMKHYDAKGLVTYAKADRIDLSPNRSFYELVGVRDALYRGKEGTFKYAASHATFDEFGRQLRADGNVHIKNSDIDLTSHSLLYNGRGGKLLVKGEVAGRLKDGQIRATNIEYKLDDGAFRAGPVYWKGMLAMNLQDPQDDKPKTWEVQGDQVTYGGKNKQIATYTNAIAADDEVIVIAPKVVHDRMTDVLTATGRVQYFSAKANFVGDKCVVYRKEKRAELVGGVLMYVKPKKDQNGKPKVEPLPEFQPLNPEQVTPTPPAKKLTEEEKKKAEELRNSKTARDFPTVMVAAKVDYWYARGSRRAVITGAPQGRQEMTDGRWRHVWTNVAYYDGEKETLKLVSSKGLKDTILKDSIGDDIHADWMEVSTQEDNDEMSGFGFKGNIVSFDNEDQGGGTTPPTQPATTPPPTKSEPPKTGTGKSTGGGTGDPKKTGGGGT